MKKGFCCIAFVLDRSGSMQSMSSEAIGGFNSFVEDQKKVPGEAVLTLVQFDHEYATVFDWIDLKKVPKLDGQTYQPRGTTALRDAMGRTIIDIGKKLSSMPEDERPEQVIFVVLTDGMENASKDFTLEKLRSMVDTQEKTFSWKFLFLGANIDAFGEAGQLNIARASAMNYSGDSKGLKMAYAVSSRAVKSIRMGDSSVDLCDIAKDIDPSYDPKTGSTGTSSGSGPSWSSSKH